MLLAFAQKNKKFLGFFPYFMTKIESEENESKDCAMKIEFIFFSAALLNTR